MAWLWQTLAIVVSASGLLVLARALFVDRSRGRRRCPKCWYDLSGSLGLRCSECGQTFSSERKLHKTRWHYKMACLGFIIMLTGGLLWKVPAAKQNGWASVMPTTVLIAILPWCADDQSPPALQLSTRWSITPIPTPTQQMPWFDEQPPPPLLPIPNWQKWLLAHRCAAILSEDRNVSLDQLAVALLDRIGPSGRPAAMALAKTVVHQNQALAYRAIITIADMGPNAEAAVPTLAIHLKSRIMSNPYDGLALASLFAIKKIGPNAKAAVPTLIDVVHAGGMSYVDPAIVALQHIGAGARESVPTLVQVASEPGTSRHSAVLALGSIGLDSPEASEAVIDALFVEQALTRDAATRSLSLNPVVRERAIGVARVRLGDPVPETRMRASMGLLALGPAAKSCCSDLLRTIATDEHRLVRAAAIQALESIQADRKETLRALEAAAQADVDPMVRTIASATIQRLGSAPFVVDSHDR